MVEKNFGPIMIPDTSCACLPIKGQATEMVPSTRLAEASFHHGWQHMDTSWKTKQTCVWHDLFLIGCCCLVFSQAAEHEMACQVASFQQLKIHGQLWYGKNLYSLDLEPIFDIFDLNHRRVVPEAESVFKIPRVIGRGQRNGKRCAKTSTGDQWPWHARDARDQD